MTNSVNGKYDKAIAHANECLADTTNPKIINNIKCAIKILKNENETRVNQALQEIESTREAFELIKRLSETNVYNNGCGGQKEINDINAAITKLILARVFGNINQDTVDTAKKILEKINNLEKQNESGYLADTDDDTTPNENMKAQKVK